MSVKSKIRTSLNDVSLKTEIVENKLSTVMGGTPFEGGIYRGFRYDFRIDWNIPNLIV